MRLLAFSDLHRDRARAERLVQMAQEADSEDEAAAKLESCPEGAILDAHSPPKGYVDDAGGRDLGSEAVFAATLHKRPRLVLCGHIHQCWGREATIGTTPVVNVGPDGRVFDI